MTKLIKVHHFKKWNGDNIVMIGWATEEAIRKLGGTKIAGRFMLVEEWELDENGCILVPESAIDPP